MQRLLHIMPEGGLQARRSACGKLFSRRGAGFDKGTDWRTVKLAWCCSESAKHLGVPVRLRQL